MKTVAIAGVGLIGGSLGLALKAAGFSGEILGISSPQSVKIALDRQAITRAATLEEAAQTADLIYLAQPIDQILKTLEVLGPLASEKCLITDAGSTKTLIDEHARRHIRRAAFAGGHPLAGKEQRGVEHADSALFTGRPYVLTPLTRPSPIDADFRRWLSILGAHIIEMTPPEHDRTVAFTSHLPQLVSTTLAAVLQNSPEPALTQIYGPGLLDMTRLALSAPDLWKSILETNRHSVLHALKCFEGELQMTIRRLETGSVAESLDLGRWFARKIRPEP